MRTGFPSAVIFVLSFGLCAQVRPLAQTRYVELTPDERADALLARMTLDEKLQLLHGALTEYNPGPRGTAGYVPGIPRLGIPSLYLADGSVGVGNSVGQATMLPSSIASAATWDLDLSYMYGYVIGAELRAYGLNVNLGGNVNLTGREPRCGRTFETKGEDPVLAGRITAAHLRGVQGQGVIAGIKHFALNDQETARFTADVAIDERGARESDLLAFEIGIKESDVQSVMCSYNLIGGTWACENDWLLNGILKGEWGFRGFVMSDWYATHSSVKAAKAGLDQEQPGGYVFGGQWDRSLKDAVLKGDLPQARVDDMTRRILRAMFASALFDWPESLQPIDRSTDEAIAQQVAEQGSVLLSNNGILPLDGAALKSIAVIGSHADIAVLTGGGSAQVIPTGGPALKLTAPCPPCWGAIVWAPSSPMKAIQAMTPGASVRFDAGMDRAKAAALAASSDVAIVFVSQWESEGMDLTTLNFTDGQDALVEAVAAANPRTVVVTQSGGAHGLPWLGKVGAVLAAWYPGQRGGEAIANILFGAVNPSGKLPMSFPRREEDLPHPVIAAPADPNSKDPFPVPYPEGFLAGYKWFDAKGIDPLFPFGYGLSYTTFAFSNLSVVAYPLESGGLRLQVDFDLENTGSRAGAETAQVYLGLPPETGEPPRRLAGWRKVLLQPGELQHVTVLIDESEASHPLSWWSPDAKRWVTPAGDYAVYVGNSASKAGLPMTAVFRVGE